MRIIWCSPSQRSDILRCRKGAVAAEFVLIVPLLMLFLFGVLQIGFAVYAYNGMVTAARTGARQIVFGANAAVAESATRAALPNWVARDAAITSVEDDDGIARVRVRVSGRDASLFGLVPMPDTLVAEGAMPRVGDR